MAVGVRAGGDQHEAAAADAPDLHLRQAELRTKQPRQDLYFELEKITVPTLLIWGINDKGGALEVGLLMLRRLKDARMHLFQNCGHWAQVEKREEFDRVVLDFFAH